MGDRFPWQQEMSRFCKGKNVALTLNCHQNFLKMIFEIKPIFLVISKQQFTSLESDLKIDRCLSKLLLVELSVIVSKLQTDHCNEVGYR